MVVYSRRRRSTLVKRRRYARRVPARPSNRKGIRRIAGRGDYWTDGTIRSVIEGLGGVGGAVAGGLTGTIAGPMGTALGGAAGLSTGYGAGNAVANILGMGDYTVKTNSLLNMGAPVPAFGDMRVATIIRHREFIQDISAVGAPNFTNLSFPVNPGLSVTFPWLSTLAQCYDQYQLLGCVFEFVSTSGTDTNTQALGSVIMASDYDSRDSNFTGKLEMENSQFCVTSKPQNNQIHPIECDPSVNAFPIKYCRSGTQPTNTDIRNYDHCNFQIATVGLPSAVGNIGELWVSYEIAFYKPQLTVIGPSIASAADHFRLGSTWASPAETTGFGTTNAIAIAKTPTVGSNLGFLIAGVNTLSAPTGLPNGEYMLLVSWVGANTTLTNSVTATFGAGLAARNFWYSGSTPLLSVSAGAQLIAQQTAVIPFTVASTLVVPSTITIASGTLPGTPTAGDILIYRLPTSLAA
ncbi:capsid protein [Crucivirus-419]|nr:capsid protein [Crucivirus-419]